MNRYVIFFISLLLAACSEKQRSLYEIKLDFGSFERSTIKVKPLDYTKTPVYKAVNQHPENFEYLEHINIYSVGHISDGLFLTGLMVTPKLPGKYPVIVFNRGGNRDLGSLIAATAVNVMAPLAAEGYIVVATNYRGNSRSEGEEQFGGEDLNDVINLINSMGEIDMADTSRVGLLGLSRGGMMNYLTLKKYPKNNLKAVVNIGGITDLSTTINHHPPIKGVLEELIPNFKNDQENEIKKRSAIEWTDQLPKKVPILILHGMKDQHVDYSQVPPFADSLEKYKIPFKLLSFKSGSHGIIEYKEGVLDNIKNWFELYVKNSLAFDQATSREIIK